MFTNINRSALKLLSIYIVLQKLYVVVAQQGLPYNPVLILPAHILCPFNGWSRAPFRYEYLIPAIRTRSKKLVVEVSGSVLNIKFGRGRGIVC